MKQLVSLYNFRYVSALVYMLQSVEYKAKPFIKWFWRFPDFNTVSRRRSLILTKPAKLLFVFIGLNMLILYFFVAVLLYAAMTESNITFGIAAGILSLVVPVLVAHIIIIPLWLGEKFIVTPRQSKAIIEAEQIFKLHQGIKIAVLGSYGKTSMKEMLLAILSSRYDVAATPGNKNVPYSHSVFAKTLTGNEEVVIIEYGEGAPGDIKRMAALSHPDFAFVTGLAPAHLDGYASLHEAANDIFSITEFVASKNIYINSLTKNYTKLVTADMNSYDDQVVLDWRLDNSTTTVEGLSIVMQNSMNVSIKISCALVGEHHIGPIMAVAAFAYKLGMTPLEIENAFTHVQPHEHRMQPYQISGAWIIDDTYNGNIEGIRAGTELLAKLSASRKIYVSPGLVDQGAETEKVHARMGHLIAEAKPDIVVLMKNSVTSYIQAGLTAAGFKGELIIEANPLEFYTNINHFVAAGDLVVMQNDWTDNYA